MTMSEKILLVIIFGLVALGLALPAQALNIRGITGINGITINKALIIKNPRDNIFSFCEPGTEEGTFICTHFLPAEKVVRFGVCKLVRTNVGPDLVCEDPV